MSRILVRDFAVTGFRSFDETVQPLSNLQAVNLIVGRNNSGKSNVLAAVQLYCYVANLNSRSDDDRAKLGELLNDPLNRPLNGKTKRCELWLPLPKSAQEVLPDFKEGHYPLKDGNRGSLAGHVEQILREIGAQLGQNGYVNARAQDRKMLLGVDKLVQRQLPLIGDAEAYSQLFQTYSNQRGGGVADWVAFFLERINPFARMTHIDFVEIPSVRKIIDSGSAFDGTFGQQKLIQTIAEWERPDLQNLVAHSQKFQLLLRFVRNVLEDDAVEIQIPFQRNTVHVIKDGKTLPVERLGTGLHQVIMLASAATVVEDSVVAIEEPETNLHPSLQRKLIRYLDQNTTNQYFITTHSAHILDAGSSAVFQVSLVDGVSHITKVTTQSHRFSAVEDLGYRASDLIQTPLVIWVEGPSDRIYLTAWLRTLEPELIEGTHFSIMFYGGRLLSHLQADDPEVDAFISLRRLNRYVVMLIDSDRRIGTAQVNATKKRLIEEIERLPSHGLAWVTEGREIENYLDEDMLKRVIKKIANDVETFPDRRGTGFRFGAALDYVAVGNRATSVAEKKVAVARTYVQESAGAIPDAGDLSSQLGRIVELIKRANGSA